MITANGTNIEIDGKPSDVLTKFSAVCAALMLCFDVQPDTLEEGILLAVETIEKCQQKDRKDLMELRKWLRDVERKVKNAQTDKADKHPKEG